MSLTRNQEHTLIALGRRIAGARLARNFGQAMMAGLAGLGISTIVAIEAGRPGVAIGNYLKVIDALGLMDQVDQLLHPSKDDVMLELAVENLPKRSRPGRR